MSILILLLVVLAKLFFSLPVTEKGYVDQVIFQARRYKNSHPFQPTNKITIVHTNDIHAHLDEFNKYGTDCSKSDIERNACFGGIARIKNQIDAIRENPDRNVLFLDAGDQFQDLMTIGNHEFDDGEEYLGQFLSTLNFPVVSSNINLKNATHLAQAGVKPYHIFPKYQLAVIGYITNTTASISMGANHIEFENPVTAVNHYVEEIHKLGIKRIICLSHNGYVDDKYLAENTHGISLIVGGHSHSLLHSHLNNTEVEGPYPTKVINLQGNPTFVVQAYRFGHYLGLVDLEFDENDQLKSLSGNPILLDQSIPKDNVTDKLVQEWRSIFTEKTKFVIGKANQDFPYVTCLYEECALGNLIADAILENRKPYNADISFINHGGLRAGFVKGPITVGDLLTVLPFPNHVTQFIMSGKEIHQVLENLAAKSNQMTGIRISTLCHWSGLVYSYNKSLPNFQKILVVQIKNQETGLFELLDFEKRYKVVSNDFISQGGDNIIDVKVDVVYGDPFSSSVESYLRKYREFSAVIEGRIVVVE